jgi:hypothetical protein
VLKPQRRTLPLPPSWGPVEYSIYKPWLSEDDADNVFFGTAQELGATHGLDLAIGGPL